MSPNPTMLINTLPVLEARASSEIENIVTTADRLFRHMGSQGEPDPASGEVIYTPPVTENRLRTHLANWERFLHMADEIEPLFLVEQGLLPMPVLYMSRYIIMNKADYYELLLNVTRNEEWEPWVLFILHGVEETSIWTTEKIAAIRELREETGKFVREKLPKIYSWELVDVLFEQPYCRIANLVEAGIVGRQAASRYLKDLSSIRVLVEQTVGRERLFTHPRLLALIPGEPPSPSPILSEPRGSPDLWTMGERPRPSTSC